MTANLPAEGIPEDRVPRILARAAELDRPTISLDTIRAAALEAGISPAAVEKALAEYAAGRVVDMRAASVLPEPPTAGKRWRRWLRNLAEPLQLGALGFALGVVGGAEDPLLLVALGSWLAITAWLVKRYRPSGKPGRFQLGQLLLAFGVMLGFGAAGGDEDVFVALLLMGIVTFVLGTALIQHDNATATFDHAESKLLQ